MSASTYDGCGDDATYVGCNDDDVGVPAIVVVVARVSASDPRCRLADCSGGMEAEATIFVRSCDCDGVNIVDADANVDVDVDFDVDDEGTTGFVCDFVGRSGTIADVDAACVAPATFAPRLLMDPRDVVLWLNTTA